MYQRGRRDSERAQREPVLNLIDDSCAIDAVLLPRHEVVAMTEKDEGTGDLLVDKVSVPLKIHDSGFPIHSQGKKAKRAKAEGDLRSGAGIG